MPNLKAYNLADAKTNAVDRQEAYKRTLARLQKIQSHLDTSPRGTRLKDRVCIITGVGSLKGIGYVVHFDRDCAQCASDPNMALE